MSACRARQADPTRTAASRARPSYFIDLAPAWPISGQVHHSVLLRRVNHNIADMGSSPPHNKLEKKFFIGLSGCDDCRSHLVPARLSPSLVCQLDKLIKASIGGQRPADGGLLRDSRVRLEPGLKAHTTVLVPQLSSRRVLGILCIYAILCSSREDI